MFLMMASRDLSSLGDVLSIGTGTSVGIFLVVDSNVIPLSIRRSILTSKYVFAGWFIVVMGR
jgi:hypothetical protein